MSASEQCESSSYALKYGRLSSYLSLGQWSGYIGDHAVFPSEPMISLDIHASLEPSNGFSASGVTSTGTRFTVSGTTSTPQDGTHSVTFQINYVARSLPRSFRGKLSDDGRELSGVWSLVGDEDDLEGTFMFRRLPPDSMRFWPLPTDGELGKPLALWRFALLAVQDQVRRRMFSSQLLSERQAIRQRYLRVIRMGPSAQLQDETDHQTLVHCYRNLTPSEARYHHSIYESTQSLTPKHL